MKRTGVIVGVGDRLTEQEAGQVARTLNAEFPGVKIAVVPGSAAVVFEYDEHRPRVAPPISPNNPEFVR